MEYQRRHNHPAVIDPEGHIVGPDLSDRGKHGKGGKGSMSSDGMDSTGGTTGSGIGMNAGKASHGKGPYGKGSSAKGYRDAGMGGVINVQHYAWTREELRHLRERALANIATATSTFVEMCFRRAADVLGDMLEQL